MNNSDLFSKIFTEYKRDQEELELLNKRRAVLIARMQENRRLIQMRAPYEPTSSPGDLHFI